MKYNNKSLIINKFTFSEIGMKKLRKNSNYMTPQNNGEKYAKWVIDTLEKFYSKTDNEKYNACCIYMNKNNIDIMHKYLEPMTWLNLSPTEYDKLGDDEFGIDLSEIVQQRI